MEYIFKKIAGIDCIFIPMNWSHSVTTRVWVKAGSDYERDKEWGISHFLEHLALNGGKKWKTGNELRDFVRDIGGEVNACTGDYRTCYYVNSQYEYAKNQIEILGDMLIGATYLDKETEAEKDIVIQEIERAKDNNVQQAYFQGRRFFMGDSSFSRNTLGISENIKGFKKSDFLDYKKELYTKDNVIIVIAGNVGDQEELENLIGENFGRLPGKKSRDLPPFERMFPNEHEMFVEKGINQPRVELFMRGLNCISENSIVCDILAEIMKRKLFQRVREELGLCYGIQSLHINQINYGFFLIETGLKRDDLVFGLEKINEVLDDLLKNGVSENELNKIKNSKRGFMFINYETPSRVADFVADQYITLDKIVFPEERAIEFSRVTMEDIDKVLPLLKRENRYTFYIK